jgi:hypothetical protein
MAALTLESSTISHIATISVTGNMVADSTTCATSAAILSSASNVSYGHPGSVALISTSGQPRAEGCCIRFAWFEELRREMIAKCCMGLGGSEIDVPLRRSCSRPAVLRGYQRAHKSSFSAVGRLRWPGQGTELMTYNPLAAPLHPRYRAGRCHTSPLERERLRFYALMSGG